MMKPGHILFHRDFIFADGSSKDKYLIVLGVTDSVVLLAKTTSKGSRYRNDFGCQAGNRYPAFYLPLGMCCFRDHTWVCFSDFYEMKKSALLQKIFAGEVNRFGLLIEEHTRDLQFCAMNCDDISREQEKVILDTLVTIQAAVLES